MKKIYFEIALIINNDMFESKQISYQIFKKAENYLLEKTKNC